MPSSLKVSSGKGSKFAFKIMKIIAAGTSPKLTRSAKESNCFPNSESVLNNRAKKPSKKSNTAAARIKNKAQVYSSFRTIYKDAEPDARFNSVIKFGICFFMRKELPVPIPLSYEDCRFKYMYLP